jgi:RecB family exonuclease
VLHTHSQAGTLLSQHYRPEGRGLGWLELAMDDTPVLLLTGFNEGFVPESSSSDVFLPNSLRMKLGLRDNRRRYARDAYALSAMLHSRQRIVFIAGRTDASGNPLTPSRLWFAADPKSLPARVQQFYGTEAAEDDNADSHLPQNAEAAAGASDPMDGPAANRLSGFTVPRPVRVPPAPAEISVTAFRDYLACPYRYFLRRELKLRPIDDRTLELEAPAFGSLIHDVLNQFGDSPYTEATTVEPIEDFLLKAARQLAFKKYGRTHSATVAVQLQMVENRLSAFAEWQAQSAAEGWRIKHTEESLKFQDFRDVQGRRVVLSGRVDRIDHNKFTNSWRVLDYKTSEKADKPEVTHFKKGEWVDLQLPLYRLLVRCLEIEEPVQLGYVHLPGDLSKVGVSIANWSDAELQSAEEAAGRIAADILDLKIDRVEPGQENRATEFARVCQDSVIDRQIPWLADWSGR